MKRQNVKTGRFLKVAVWVRTWQKEWQKSASGNSKSSMLMLSKIIHKLWSMIFFRINICVFKGLFKHGSAGAPYFLSQKKSTQPKLLTFQQRLVLMVAMMRRPRWLRMGRSLQPIGWLEGSDLEPGKVLSTKKPSCLKRLCIAQIPSKSYGASISGY